MSEGWIRKLASHHKVKLEVASAGTEKTRVKDDAITVMKEVGIDLNKHHSKTLHEVEGPWDYVITVCDSANEACPRYPEETTRLHVAFPDPSHKSLDAWRTVRDSLKTFAERLVLAVKEGRTVTEEELHVPTTLPEE